MAGETIIQRISDLYLIIGGLRITALPSAGTLWSMEKIDPNSTMTGGLFGTITFVRSNATNYRLTVNVVQNSSDDRFLGLAVKALNATNTVLGVDITYGTTKYASGSCDVETIPTREYTGDTAPTVAWVITGSFPVAEIGTFVAPEVLTADQINSYA